MKTKKLGGQKMIVEEFTMEEMKEYLEHLIKYSDSPEKLSKMAASIHGKDRIRFYQDSKTFKIFTPEKMVWNDNFEH